jgi:hypothetical protein
MLLDLIKVNADGQLEFDFDSIAARSSKLMSEVVRMRLKGFDVKEATLTEKDDVVTVQFISVFRTGKNAFFYVFDYFKKYDLFEVSCAVWMERDREWKPVRDAD